MNKENKVINEEESYLITTYYKTIKDTKENVNNNLNQENNMLKDKINSLTSQLDRLINLVEKSNSQNIKKIYIIS